jgi:AcrR family transcriptional regulator
MARADRAEQLLATAEEVFVERGLHAASMDEVAERAGVTKPVLYDHFGSKDGVLAAVMGRLGGRLRAATVAAVAGAGDPREALHRGLVTYFRFLDDHANGWSLLLTGLSASGEAARAVEEVRRTQAGYIASLIAAELAPAHADRADVYAHAVVGAAERIATVRRQDTSLTAERASTELLDLLWLGFAGLRGEPAPPRA